MSNSILCRTAVRLLLAAALLGLQALLAPAGTPIEAARVREVAALLPAQPAGFGPRAADRAAWERLAKLPAFSGVVAKALKLAQEPVPAVPDDLFLDFSRTGNRERCQRVLSARTARLFYLTLAECLEHQGRFVQPAAETIEALCAEQTWVLPAHDRKLDNFHRRKVDIDLRASGLAWELATVDYLLGNELPPATRQRLRENVRRRVLQPFRDMVEGRREENYWLRATHNWNAVCLAGVSGAALALEESRESRAWFIAAAQHYLRFFLSGFTPDGYCSEGMGYWNYGFGHFLMLGEAVRQATANRVDLLADPAAMQPALYSARTEILNGIYPTIADCHPGSRPTPQYVRYLGERFGLPQPNGPQAEFAVPAGSLVATTFLCFLERPMPVIAHAPLAPESQLRTWFKEGGVLLCRPAPDSDNRFAAVLKGGHNAEHHNHNDVGSFSVVSGRSMLLCDPGGEVYTARTFGSHRYDSQVLSSYGHAVPVVAGQLQRTGREARAVVRRTDFRDAEDTLVLDLSSAYRAPKLQRLERTFTFQRGKAAALTVRDEVAFQEPQSFETALVTWGRWEKLSRTELSISEGKEAVRVTIDTGGRPFSLEAEELKEDVSTKQKPQRLGIKLTEPVKEATVTLKITPAADRKAKPRSPRAEAGSSH